MARSSKKGPFIYHRLLKKIAGKTPKEAGKIKVWKRAAVITPEMVGYTFLVHKGNGFVEVTPTEEMVGHRLGEFAPTTKFIRHGGKMQKELEQRRRQAEIEAAKAARAAVGK